MPLSSSASVGARPRRLTEMRVTADEHEVGAADAGADLGAAARK